MLLIYDFSLQYMNELCRIKYNSPLSLQYKPILSPKIFEWRELRMMAINVIKTFSNDKRYGHNICLNGRRKINTQFTDIIFSLNGNYILMSILWYLLNSKSYDKGILTRFIKLKRKKKELIKVEQPQPPQHYFLQMQTTLTLQISAQCTILFNMHDHCNVVQNCLNLKIRYKT